MARYRLASSMPFVVVVCVLLCSSSNAQMRGYFPKPGPDDTVQDVSLIQLIAQPEKFDAKRVRFIGFLRLEFEGNAIYLHRDDFDHGISKNGLWINVPSDMTKHHRNRNKKRRIARGVIFTQ